jgi:ankyrin repeat protein
VQHREAWCGDEAMTRLLFNRGADINAITNDGETALHQAVVVVY